MSKGIEKKAHSDRHSTAHPHVCRAEIEPQEILALHFKVLCPPPSISLTDIQCPICKCVVDQPIEIPCKVPVCLDCCLWLIQKGDISNCPSCGSEHEVNFSTFSQIPAFLLKSFCYSRCYAASVANQFVLSTCEHILTPAQRNWWRTFRLQQHLSKFWNSHLIQHS